MPPRSLREMPRASGYARAGSLEALRRRFRGPRPWLRLEC